MPGDSPYLVHVIAINLFLFYYISACFGGASPSFLSMLVTSVLLLERVPTEMIGQKYAMTNRILCIPPPTFPLVTVLWKTERREGSSNQINMQILYNGSHSLTL